MHDRAVCVDPERCRDGRWAFSQPKRNLALPQPQFLAERPAVGKRIGRKTHPDAPELQQPGVLAPGVRLGDQENDVAVGLGPDVQPDVTIADGHRAGRPLARRVPNDVLSRQGVFRARRSRRKKSRHQQRNHHPRYRSFSHSPHLVTPPRFTATTLVIGAWTWVIHESLPTPTWSYTTGIIRVHPWLLSRGVLLRGSFLSPMEPAISAGNVFLKQRYTRVETDLAREKWSAA